MSPFKKCPSNKGYLSLTPFIVMLNLKSSATFIKHLCSEPSDVPTAALAFMKPELVEQVGKPATEIFTNFAHAFPLTAKVIQTYWPAKTQFVLTQSSNWWRYEAVLERADLNLFFNSLPHPDAETQGEFFNEDHAMLPRRWVELYRWFDSFCVIENAMGGNVIKNTPFTYSGRLGLEDFRQNYELKKADIRDFSKAIDSKQLRCWMVTDGGNSIWLDEQRCDHKVYHVKSGDFKNFYILPDPELTLDKYLAHYVAGGKPEDFDFRQT